MNGQDYVIGIDIGGTNMRIGAVSEKDEISLFERASSDVFHKKGAVDYMAEYISQYFIRHKLKNRIRAVSIGIPAIISKDRKSAASCPNLKGLEGVNIVDALFEKLSLPIFLDRDVNNLLINDIEALKLDKTKTVCGFYIGTGFGNAIFTGGEIYRGKNCAAGELGHIPLYGVTDNCTCGNEGCVETRCSGKYLERLCRKHFPGTDIHSVFERYPHSEVLHNFVRELAYPIATEITILDPDFCVIAGGVTDMPSFPKKLLSDEIFRRVRKPYPFANLEILYSVHNQQSGVSGSAAAAFHKLNKENHI